MSGTGWIWYPGDFELYHGMLQNFQREERSYGWPAYWKMDDWRKNVRLYNKYQLKEKTRIRVTAAGQGYVAVNGRKFPFDRWIDCPEGACTVEIFVGNMFGLPCAYVEGDVICSDASWMADDFTECHPVGMSSLYRDKEKDPNKVYYETEELLPVSEKEVCGGVLMDFGRMINGTVRVTIAGDSEKASEQVSEAFAGEDRGQDVRRSAGEVTVAYGESAAEATDLTWCYYKSEHVVSGDVLRRRAFRYLYLPGCRVGHVSCAAEHQWVPIPVKASFWCDDEKINRIWDVAKETYRLCSGLFFIDGIKRDRWIWSGDAYQSYFVNPYLFMDEEIDKRTILALRGNQDIVQHINTIVDYSMLWLISIEKEYWITGDREFVRMIYPKMEGMMRLLESQLDEHGFIRGRERDWIFIDWSDIDKTGAVCAEQVLLLKCYDVMAFCGKLLAAEDGAEASEDGTAPGASETGAPAADYRKYEQAYERLKANLFAFFWNEEKGAFIDSYESGRNHVTRHANIFAILFDVVDEARTRSIIDHVLLNPDITRITTPYFKFFELDVWGKTGHLDQVYEAIRDYWGGMIDRGAVTFWEDYDAAQGEPEQYGMYGDPFGKSLCHAWGASPIYLLGRYFLGVRPLEPGYKAFEAKPQLSYFRKLDCVVPVKGGSVSIKYDGEHLEVASDRAGLVE